MFLDEIFVDKEKFNFFIFIEKKAQKHFEKAFDSCEDLLLVQNK